MTILLKVLSVLVLLGGLIFVHELGHFLVAKAFRVKVLRFSLGFGPRIFGFTRGETEYRVCWLPLGGYVKMAGEDPSAPVAPEDEGRGFMHQPPWKRFLIAFAGPGMNLVFPALIYFGFFAGSTEPAAIVGYADPARAGARQGLLAGDKVLAVDNELIRDFRDLQRAVQRSPGRALAFEIERGGARLSLTIVPDADTEETPIESRVVGRLGVTPSRVASLVAVTEGGPAAQAGIQTFDRVVEVGGRAVATWPELTSALAAAGDAPVEITVERAGGAQPERWRVTITPREGDFGLSFPASYVWTVTPGTPAAEAGIARGDRLVSLDGAPVATMAAVRAAISRALDQRPLTLVVERAGERRTLTLTARAEQAKDEMRTRFTRYVLGLRIVGTPMDGGEALDEAVLPPAQMVDVGLAGAAARSVDTLGSVMRMMVLGIAALFRGAVPLDTVGGPIMLMDIASKSAERGLEVFLHNMALISVNLGLLNLLPIPVLDGGHLVAALVEAVRRRPLSLRFREVANMVGIALLLMLMVFAFKNDIVRYFLP